MKNQKLIIRNFSLKFMLAVLTIFLFYSTIHAQPDRIIDAQNLENNNDLVVNPGEFMAIQPQQVPNLVGKLFHPDTIMRYLDGTGYKLRNSTPIENNRRIGFIVEQHIERNPPEDEEIPIDVIYAIEEHIPSRRVRVNPNITPIIPDDLVQIQKVKVPQLQGKMFDYYRITEFLKESRLQIGDTVSVINNQRAGLVIRQYPIAGTEVRYNTPVNIAYGVESPPENVTQTPQDSEIVTVPKYTGLTIERVIRRIPNDRLTFGGQEDVNSDSPPGIVVNQFPEAGMKVDPGTEISLEISIGPPEETRLVRVPQLIEKTLQEAAEILRETELFVGDIREQISEKPGGIIIQQFPRAGTEVKRGAVVDIVYSINEIMEILVPDVKMLPRDEAILVIKESRLNYSERNVNEPGIAEGVVVDQFPEPETLVPIGTNVKIFVQNNKNTLPLWVYWGGGVLVAGLLGGFIGRKVNPGRKKKIVGEKDTSVHLKPVWDIGKQTIISNENNLIQNKVHLKYISDKGIQTIKNS